MPHVPGADYLLGYFFEFGPAKKDGPVEVGDVLDWGRALGIEWAPWHIRLFVRLSRDYCAAQYKATKYDAAPPWPGAVKMWRWVRNEKAERRLDRDMRVLEQRKEARPDGDRKRRRDPTSG